MYPVSVMAPAADRALLLQTALGDHVFSDCLTEAAVKLRTHAGWGRTIRQGSKS